MSPPPKARGTRRSSVSRRWKRATEAALAELMARDLSDLDVAVVMVDGIELAGQCVVAALVVTTDGTKVPVGLWLGDTENKTVVTAYWPTWWPGASAARRACSSSSTGPRPGDRRGQGVRGKSSCTKVHFAQAAKCPGPPASRAGDKVDRRLALGWLWRTSCSESTRWQAMRSAGAISRRGWHSLDQLIFKPCLSMPSTRGCRTRRSIGPQPLIGVGRIGARHDRVLEVFGTLPARSATSSAKILGSSPPVIGRRVA
jgi:hypothetical protein